MQGGDRPGCPRGCQCRIHRHGYYSRYASASGSKRIEVQRFWCPHCGLTISVLLTDQLPYRPLEVKRLEAFFNKQAKVGSGPDPPPDELEAGCLHRAWTRFQARVHRLKEAFGLLIVSATHSASTLWKQMRLAKATLEGILLYLGQSCNASLLGDYQCLRLPS